MSKTLILAVIAAAACTLAGCHGRHASDPVPQGDTVEVTIVPASENPTVSPDSIHYDQSDHAR